MVERVALTAADGVVLEGEVAPASGTTRAGMVLCHPHPQFGGTMRSIVIGALFDALPAAGVDCLRFNFRGVEGSTGTYSAGDRERLDVQCAIAALHDRLPNGVPLVLTGWSFGADVALSCADPAIAGWLLVASPLRFARDVEVVAHDARPKHFVLAERDEFRDPADVARDIEDWANVRVAVVGGASHFFVGRTEHVVAQARLLLDALAD